MKSIDVDNIEINGILRPTKLGFTRPKLKIAVFAKYRQDVDYLKPTNLDLIHIRSEGGLNGRKFDGFICCFRWHEDALLEDALIELKERQPELFNDDN